MGEQHSYSSPLVSPERHGLLLLLGLHQAHAQKRKRRLCSSSSSLLEIKWIIMKGVMSTQKVCHTESLA